MKKPLTKREKIEILTAMLKYLRYGGGGLCLALRLVLLDKERGQHSVKLYHVGLYKRDVPKKFRTPGSHSWWLREIARWGNYSPITLACQKVRRQMVRNAINKLKER